MEKDLILKVLHNKKNNQLSIILPRRELGIKKLKVPKEAILNIKKLKFMEGFD